MKTRIIQIGNSRGIRIPKVLLEQSGLSEKVELKAEKEKIIIKPIKKTREGWAEAFKEMAEKEDDELLDKDVLHAQSNWDEEEWVW